MNRRYLRLVVGMIVLFCVGGTLMAQTTTKQYVFPAKGQSAEQQSKDVAGCDAWAKTETGFDPAKPPVYQAPPPPPPPPKGSALRGAARGAAAGYIVGDIANDEGGEGAAIGAVVGAARSSRGNQQAAQASSQQAAAQQQAFNDKVAAMNAEYSKARSACLEAKGYTVK
jgi:hypothetical protein